MLRVRMSGKTDRKVKGHQYFDAMVTEDVTSFFTTEISGIIRFDLQDISEKRKSVTQSPYPLTSSPQSVSNPSIRSHTSSAVNPRQSTERSAYFL